MEGDVRHRPESPGRGSGDAFAAFDAETAYDTYVDGTTRADGTRSFLASRHTHLPDGAPGDLAGTTTVDGLGNAKNEIVLRKIMEVGGRGLSGLGPGRPRRRAATSSSANYADVLAAAGIAGLFEKRIDDVAVEADHLAGKPASDTYAATRGLDVAHAPAAVFEDALARVEAGRTAGLGFVVGVDLAGQAERLHSHGPDIAVDLAKLPERPWSADHRHLCSRSAAAR